MESAEKANTFPMTRESGWKTRVWNGALWVPDSSQGSASAVNITCSTRDGALMHIKLSGWNNGLSLRLHYGLQAILRNNTPSAPHFNDQSPCNGSAARKVWRNLPRAGCIHHPDSTIQSAHTQLSPHPQVCPRGVGGKHAPSASLHVNKHCNTEAVCKTSVAEKWSRNNYQRV